MALWKRRGNYQDVASMVIATSGMDMNELVSPAKVSASEIDQIPEAAELLSECIQKEIPIYIVGDYDADGITATAILARLLQWYGVSPKTIIPKRFSDGYGISDKLLEGIENALIITVDNGITAEVPLHTAKEKGNRIIILDHHMSTVIPNVDVVVDPHVTSGHSTFSDYCGAGLALKLCEQLLPYPGEYPELFYNLTVLACLGTIADVVPLHGDNRRIVREGLQIMRSKKGMSLLFPGLREILKLVGEGIDEETIKFSIAPLINAPGRMYDAGSTSVLRAFLCDDVTKASEYASKMKQINEQRKSAVAHWNARYLEKIEKEQSAQVVMLQDVPEGIIGIIAGNLAEQFHMPTIVFTNAKESDVLKGSARSYGDFDLFQMIEHIREDTIAAGGHAGAAGLSIASDKYELIKEKIQKYVRDSNYIPEEDAIFYDIELRSNEIPTAYQAQKQFGPYGEGCPQPVFLLRNFQPVSKYGEIYRFLGGNAQHVKLQGQEFEVIAFNAADQFRELGLPEVIDLLCTIGVNVYNGKTTIQLKPIDFKVSMK